MLEEEITVHVRMQFVVTCCYRDSVQLDYNVVSNLQKKGIQKPPVRTSSK